MEKEFIDQQQKILEIEKIETEKELQKMGEKNKEGEWEADFPNEPNNTDIEDEAGEVEEYENLLPVEFVFQEKLKNINLALEKIANGSYGICENCKKEISKERLLAFPEAKNCNDCSADK
ncbi:MAG: TraR/DksA C4-type zinc finger protein [Candidatus Paceibacterota bacterium]|jgi:RNA polymerase-binding transcription factor DksA